MFTYCLNTPSTYIDTEGTASETSLTAETDTMSSPFDDVTTGGLAFLGLGIAIVNGINSQKPINLPSHKKVKLDMTHISSGHMPGGDRNPKGNKSVFWGLTVQQVIKAIYEAYNTSSKLQTQGPRIRLIGYSSTFQTYIEMWLNTITKIIETAYPK